MSSSSSKAEGLKIKLFGMYPFGGVEVKDKSLVPYISLTPILTPWSGGRYEHNRFGKNTVNIVERLTNKLMRHGKIGGKKVHAINILKTTFRIIELETGKNPIQALVDAIQNAAPCEDVTTISYGGAVYHVSVDVSPQRRVDVALRHITDGARRSVHANRLSIEESLANEIVATSRNDSSCYAIKKRVELERIAVTSR